MNYTEGQTVRTRRAIDTGVLRIDEGEQGYVGSDAEQADLVGLGSTEAIVVHIDGTTPAGNRCGFKVKQVVPFDSIEAVPVEAVG